MPTEVLVTGGAGYLGSVLSEHLLQAGYAVTVLDNLSFDQISQLHLCHQPYYNFVRGDARDEGLLKKLLATADVVIPLAAVVGAPACDRDPWLAQSLNYDAIALINRLRRPQQLVLFPTTNSGYGTKSGEVFCTEETPLEPISLYGRSKAAAEQLLLDSGHAITLRLATLFGASPRMRLDLLVNDFVYCAITQKYLVVFERDFKRNFIHIRDAADCFVHCIKNAKKMLGRPFNVGNDSENLSKAELAEKIQRELPALRIHYDEVGQDPDRRNYVVSNERLRQSGFTARRSLADGIRELIKAYQTLPRPSLRNV